MVVGAGQTRVVGCTSVLRCAQVLATCLEARATEMAVADLAKALRASGDWRYASRAPSSRASLRRQLR